MKEKISGILEKIKGLYTNENTKKKAIIATVCIGVVLFVTIGILLANAVVSGLSDEKDKEKNNVLEEITATPLPTVTVEVTPTPSPSPTPEPTSTPTPTPTPSPTPTPDPAELHAANGEKQSYINGNWVKNEIADTRPYCMMFNNISVANPQSGIGCADILYEILTEAGITRCMGVFENLTEESSCKDRMGSVRSARHYFASIASEYDAIFIHFGETVYATRKIKALKLDHLEGTYAEGSTVFYRDKNIKAPHNAFATLEGIHKAIENKKFRTVHNEDFVPQHFKFAYPVENTEEVPDDTDTETEEVTITPSAGLEPTTEETPLVTGTEAETETTDDTEDPMLKYYTSIELASETTDANLVKLGFSNYATPYLAYDETSKLYTRYQYGGEHIDYNTNEPLRFNNIIVQIVHEYNIDKNGYQEIQGFNESKDMSKNLQGEVSGKGYYICEGKCIEITWTKCEKEYRCNYYTTDGELLTIRPGKTFIAVYPDSRLDKLEIN